MISSSLCLSSFFLCRFFFLSSGPAAPQISHLRLDDGLINVHVVQVHSDDAEVVVVAALLPFAPVSFGFALFDRDK